MEWMLLPYKRYADFTGRSRRKEYWMFQLFLILAYMAIFIVTSILGVVMGEAAAYLMTILVVVVLFGSIVPAIAVTVRRFHDQGKTGWMALLSLIPLGGIVVLVFMCLEGESGDNEYGPDPKGGVNPNTFS